MKIYQKNFYLIKGFPPYFHQNFGSKGFSHLIHGKKNHNCQLSSLAQASMSNQLANQAYLLLKKKSDSFCNSNEHVFKVN